MERMYSLFMVEDSIKKNGIYDQVVAVLKRMWKGNF